MLPKIIHYCWFGGNPLPKSAIKCKESWKKFLPDYEIKEWNESNFDVNLNAYTKFCYENKLWAFLSDYVRLAVVENEGGLYFDTDVEVINGIDGIFKLMKEHNATAFFGFETSNYVASGLGFGAIAHHPAVQAMMDLYVNSNGAPVMTRLEVGNMTGCPAINTAVFTDKGLKMDGTLQSFFDSIILPPEYMCPLETITGVMNKTPNTFSIHWFTMSAQSSTTRLRMKITRPIHRLIELFK